MDPTKKRSILNDFDFTVEHCIPRVEENMKNERLTSIMDLLNKYPLQICVTEKRKLKNGPLDLAEAIRHGTKLLDAALYLKLPPHMRPNPVLINEEQLRQRPNKATIEIYIFVLYYYLVTEGRVPNEQDKLSIGLRHFLMIDKRPFDICRELASFPLSKLAHPWIRDLSHILDKKVVESIVPVVAGYRYMVPFTKYRIVKMVPIHVLEAAMAVRKFCSRGPVWDSHPLCMTREFQAATGGHFLQNLINLIYEVYTPPQIVDMIKLNLLPPNAHPNDAFKHYLSWTDSVFDEFKDYIFPKQMTMHISP